MWLILAIIIVFFLFLFFNLWINIVIDFSVYFLQIGHTMSFTLYSLIESLLKIEESFALLNSHSIFINCNYFRFLTYHETFPHSFWSLACWFVRCCCAVTETGWRSSRTSRGSRCSCSRIRWRCWIDYIACRFFGNDWNVRNNLSMRVLVIVRDFQRLNLISTRNHIWSLICEINDKWREKWRYITALYLRHLQMNDHLFMTKVTILIL